MVWALVWNSGTESCRGLTGNRWEREYAEAESRRREYRMRRTGADCGVVAMKGL